MATRDPQEQGTALRWALNALNRLAEESEHFATDEDADDEGAFVNAVQAVWWVASINEQLVDDDPGQYPQRRDNEPDGLTVAGLTWLRDRHSHQAPITTGKDKTPFFLGPPWHIVSGKPQWLPSSKIEPSTRTDTNYVARTALYDQHVAGETVSATLRAARRWFDKEASRPGSLLDRAAQVHPGLHADAVINRRKQ
jgi:hypothetical protein